MKIKIRLEEAKDYDAVEFLTREAFWDVYKPGCDEHLILHKLRDIPTFVSELDFVAVSENEIVGHIIYSEAKVVSSIGQENKVLTFGPLSVLPSLQKKGIGSLLIEHSIEKARQQDYKAVIIYGNPKYYHRFGFKNAMEYGITTPQGDNFEAFMALELYDDSLKGIEGKFYVDDVFETNSNELEEFEKKFPFKEKHVTDTQL